MTDKAEVTAKQLAEINIADITDFVNEKVKNHLCPCCSANDWVVLGDKENFVAWLGISKEHGFTLPPPAIAIVALECKNCAFIRNHSLTAIAQWKITKAQ